MAVGFLKLIGGPSKEVVREKKILVPCNKPIL
jgi:hypothetical protein